MRGVGAASAGERLTKGLQILPDLNTLPVVHRQQLHGGAANRRPAEKDRAFPREVIRPAVRRGWNSGTSWPLSGSRPAMFGPLWKLQKLQASARLSGSVGRHAGGDDMFDVEADKPRGRLRQPAVFTNIAGSTADQRPKRVVHHDYLRS